MLSYSIRLTCLVLCVACVVPVRARQQPEARQPAQQKQEAAPAKKNARPEGEAVEKLAEPFDKAAVAEMSKQCVTLDTESGEISIEMLAEAAPETVRNFLNLSATGAFDTTTFSRVVKGFIVQGGNLTTREKISNDLLRRASRTIADEPNAVKHVRGVVSMARSDQPNSASTHFFILVGDAPHLDGTFAAFGRVARGMDVVDAINSGELEGDKPKNPVRIKRAVVAACPAPAN